MKPLTVYAKLVKTDCLPEGADANDPFYKDVQIFRDRKATKEFVHYTWFSGSKKPNRRNKYITLNCYKWKLEWI